MLGRTLWLGSLLANRARSHSRDLDSVSECFVVRVSPAAAARVVVVAESWLKTMVATMVLFTECLWLSYIIMSGQPGSRRTADTILLGPTPRHKCSAGRGTGLLKPE